VQRAVELTAAPAQAGWSERALAFASAHRGATDCMAQRLLALLPV
jgi:hypothetical protein